MFSYDPLWKTLIDKKMNKTDLRKNIKFSTSTLAQMGKGEYISMETIDKICTYLEVPIEQVIYHIKEIKEK